MVIMNQWDSTWEYGSYSIVSNLWSRADSPDSSLLTYAKCMLIKTQTRIVSKSYVTMTMRWSRGGNRGSGNKILCNYVTMTIFIEIRFAFQCNILRSMCDKYFTYLKTRHKELHVNTKHTRTKVATNTNKSFPIAYLHFVLYKGIEQIKISLYKSTHTASFAQGSPRGVYEYHNEANCSNAHAHWVRRRHRRGDYSRW